MEVANEHIYKNKYIKIGQKEKRGRSKQKELLVQRMDRKSKVANSTLVARARSFSLFYKKCVNSFLKIKNQESLYH